MFFLEPAMNVYAVSYIDTEGQHLEMEVEEEDEANAEEAAREELAAEYPSFDTDVWEITSVILKGPASMTV